MSLEVHVRVARVSDCGQLSELRESLWPEASAQQHREELIKMLTAETAPIMPGILFVAESGEGELVGFLEANLRSHADGCDPSRPVGFIEGWYVSPGVRKQGVGTRLLRAAEEWARSLGCVEMASDTWIDNEVSQRVHEALGYEVVDRCVHYHKRL